MFYQVLVTIFSKNIFPIVTFHKMEDAILEKNPLHSLEKKNFAIEIKIM